MSDSRKGTIKGAINMCENYNSIITQLFYIYILVLMFVQIIYVFKSIMAQTKITGKLQVNTTWIIANVIYTGSHRDHWCMTSRRHDVTSFCDSHWSNLRFIGIVFQNALVEYIGVYTDTNYLFCK